MRSTRAWVLGKGISREVGPFLPGCRLRVTTSTPGRRFTTMETFLLRGLSFRTQSPQGACTLSDFKARKQQQFSFLPQALGWVVLSVLQFACQQAEEHFLIRTQALDEADQTRSLSRRFAKHPQLSLSLYLKCTLFISPLWNMGISFTVLNHMFTQIDQAVQAYFQPVLCSFNCLPSFFL